tara:strand:- start:10594 stop:13575 length:2982 start_codon:yes stop_codon:yes gene_type:complete
MENIFVPWKSQEQENESGMRYGHPSRVYETKHMSMIKLPEIKQNIVFDRELRIDESTTEFISDVQMEAVEHAMNVFKNADNIDKEACGFILGDGTGVGKTRTLTTIACLFNREYENANIRILWVTNNSLLEKNIEKELKLFRDNKKDVPEILKKKDLKTNGIATTTYSSLIRETNYIKFYEWLDDADEILIILDEAHTAKNSRTLIGANIVRLQRNLPRACVVYSTATAASEIRQMHYMIRLNLWKEDYSEFMKRLERYGSTVMELVALQLKSEGRLVSRHLGFDNIRIHLKTCFLTQEEHTYYDILSKKWRSINTNGLDFLSFFRCLITKFKVKHLIKLVEETIANNETVVIGIQSTGETAENRNEMSILKDICQRNNIDIENIDFPRNPIDMIIQYFGVDKVAEVSGRQTRTIMRDGNYVKETVPSSSLEVKSFQDYVKPIIIISKAGSAGISLHSEKAKHNVKAKRRHHIILETPWTAESLMQQIGRTHRTNSETHPYYTILVTDIPSEYRYFYGLTRKFENLGALTKGDKRATLFDNLSFHGCDNLSMKAFQHIQFELNFYLGIHWFNRHKEDNEEFFRNTNLANAQKGLNLYLQKYRLSSDDKLRGIYKKIFLRLNEKSYFVNYNHRNRNVELHSMRILSLNFTCHEWRSCWRNIAEERDIIYTISDCELYLLYLCCLRNVQKYLSKDKYYFRDDYFHDTKRETLNSLLLCSSRPECEKTLGLIPNDLINEIVQWNFGDTNICNIDWDSLYRNDNVNIYKLLSVEDCNVFLNTLFTLPIYYQNIFHHFITLNCQQHSSKKDVSIMNTDKYIFGNRTDLKIEYDKILKVSEDFVDIHLRTHLKYELEYYLDQFQEWKNEEKVLGIIRNLKTNKMGILVKNIKKDTTRNWEKEIWYPCSTRADLCFSKFQWETRNCEYDIQNENIYETWKELIYKKYNNILVRNRKKQILLRCVVKNIISHWPKSRQKLIRIENENYSPFIGLVMFQKYK